MCVCICVNLSQYVYTMKLRDSKLSSSQASAAHFQVGLMPPDIPKNAHGTSEYHVDMWLYMS